MFLYQTSTFSTYVLSSKNMLNIQRHRLYAYNNNVILICTEKAEMTRMCEDMAMYLLHTK